MINVKPVPTIMLLITFSLLAFLLAWVAFGGGCKEKVEANDLTYICAYCPHIGWFGDPNSCKDAAEARVSEPNELECKHEFTIDCAVGGCNDCLKCMYCGEDLFPKGGK